MSIVTQSSRQKKHLRVGSAFVSLFAAIAFVSGCGGSDESEATSESEGTNTAKAVDPKSSDASVADVTISKCEISSTLKAPRATLTVKNTSGAANSYLVTVAFNAPDGTEFGTNEAYVASTAAGAISTESEATLLKKNAPAGLTCKATKVSTIPG